MLLHQRSSAQDKIKNANNGYQLVWADEFNKEGSPDSTNWQFEQGFVRNHELQWYQQQNAVCHNGMLIIEARKEHSPNPGYDSTSSQWNINRSTIEYTSASINTRNHHSWQYGRFVMRARIDVSPGMWPAFWTLGDSKPWPSNGEIDIMEYYRNMLLANIACGTATPYKAKWFSNKKEISTFSDPDWANKFHIWRMDWDESAISLYVDDLLLNRVALNELVNRNGSGFNPFKQPHYILLNLAIGGDNGGDPSLTTFPRKFEVDYVRVYQRQP
ncbi:glycoside hydrolase family 16 protein [Mucilaginibacter sp. RS28]|uniref:Glycoside hydrolase family 16 protein n=1 Tax=Mucilaginibacter straminoryzae TaxID=2932774 RepID=A0A9X1X1W4_9SPHI|nr:glycoside hydrolase family 16 protein [Mucilaginibacter straminoryzae]MCJ8209121.1 glycoside hydrolase family 16 protein [Mucilaginibacter straminoryzae]